jgi:hypothetical protein
VVHHRSRRKYCSGNPDLLFLLENRSGHGHSVLAKDVRSNGVSVAHQLGDVLYNFCSELAYKFVFASGDQLFAPGYVSCQEQRSLKIDDIVFNDQQNSDINWVQIRGKV